MRVNEREIADTCKRDACMACTTPAGGMMGEGG